MGAQRNIKATQARHLVVEQQQIKWLLRDQHQRFVAIGCDRDEVAASSQQHIQREPNRRFIIDNQNARRLWLHHGLQYM